MNGALRRRPHPRPPLLTGNQGATARNAAAPHYYQRGGVSMTEDEAYKMHIQYTFNALCKIWILKTGGSGQTANLSGNGAESITSRKPRRSAAAALFR